MVPTSSALQLSRKAPAKISLALAVCSFTRMVRGRVVRGSPTALTALSSLNAPVCVTTMGALSARRMPNQSLIPLRSGLRHHYGRLVCAPHARSVTRCERALFHNHAPRWMGLSGIHLEICGGVSASVTESAMWVCNILRAGPGPLRHWTHAKMISEAERQPGTYLRSVMLKSTMSAPG